MGARAGGGIHCGPRKFFAEVREQLLAFAESEFRLSVTQPDGCTLREHLESLAKQAARSGKPPPDGLAGPECPECAAYVWDWFCEVARRRSGNGFGPNPVSYGEIADWARLTCTRPSAMEVEWILALDDAQAAASAERAPVQQGGQKRGKPK